MNFSGVPTEPIAKKNLDVNETWFNWFSEINSQLQEYLSNEGYVISQLTNDQITQLNSLEGNTAKIIYNTTTQRIMINNTGTFVNIATS